VSPRRSSAARNGREPGRSSTKSCADGREPPPGIRSAFDQEYSPKWLTDLEGSFRTTHYTFAAGIQNLFDVFPDRNTTVNSFNGIQTFPSHSPFGMNGRALYTRIGWIF
jgi:iron complex outermembrane receptor protein